MSYDISITDPSGYKLWEASVSYNVRDMLSAAGLWLYDLDKERCGIAIVALDRALSRLVDHQAEASELEPDNGWGSYEDLFRFMIAFAGACARAPHAMVRVS